MREKIISWFHYGLDRMAYKEAKIRIRKYNLKRLRMFSAIVGAIFLCLFFSTYLTSKSPGMLSLRENTREYYLYVGVVAVLIYIVTLNFLERYKYFVIIAWYLLLGVLFYFAIWIAINVQISHPAVAFCVFIMALPSMFIDRSYRIVPIMLGLSGLFLYLSYTSKIFSIFMYDFGNVLTFLIMGIFMTFNNRHIQIRAITNEILLERQRDIDPLSTINNRKAFERNVKNLSENSSGTLIILDLDDFKSFNDDYGHVYGDGVIREVGVSIKEVFKDNAVVGRYGGDEFLIYLINNTDKEQIQKRFNDLNNRVNQVENKNVRKVFLSGGAAIYPNEGRKYSEVFYLADERLLSIKRHKKGTVNFGE